MGGLIVATVVAGVGLAVSRLGDVRFRDVLLYGVLPVFAIAMVVGLVRLTQRMRREFRQFQLWRAAVTSQVKHLLDSVQATEKQLNGPIWQSLDERINDLAHGHLAHALRHVIVEAESRRWRTERHAGGLDFIEPEDGYTTTIGLHELDEEAVADQLHNLSPHHFPSEWHSPQTVLIDELADDAEANHRQAMEAVAKLGELADLLPAVELLNRKVGNGWEELLEKAARDGWSWTDITGEGLAYRFEREGVVLAVPATESPRWAWAKLKGRDALGTPPRNSLSWAELIQWARGLGFQIEAPTETRPAVVVNPVGAKRTVRIGVSPRGVQDTIMDQVRTGLSPLEK